MPIRTFAPLLLAALLCAPALAQEPDGETGATPEYDGYYIADADVTGWEGFFPLEHLSNVFFEARSLPFNLTTVIDPADRVAKLTIDDGPREASAADLELLHERYCTDPAVRAWSEDRCTALEVRTCEGDTCTYTHFGNCSGIIYDSHTFLTAAHCVDGMVDHPERRPTSAILLPGPDGPVRLPLGDITVGKTDFDHHWVALDDADPVDVAAVTIVLDEPQPTYPIAPLPEVGAPLFILGYPRVERRDPAALEAAHYALNFGTPSASFGRLADRNDADLPLCNVDGYQEHWALTDECPSGPVQVEGFDTWRGVITRSPMLTTYDSCNGYSGAPVFDAHGRLVGINTTLMSATAPQEAFDPAARMVAIPITRAMQRLGLPRDPPPGTMPYALPPTPEASEPPPSTPVMAARQPLIIRGSLDRTRISEVLDRHAKAFDACCTDHLQRDPPPLPEDGDLEVELRFIIDNTGHVTHVTVRRDELGNEPYNACLTRVLRQLRFHLGASALNMVDMTMKISPGAAGE